MGVIKQSWYDEDNDKITVCEHPNICLISIESNNQDLEVLIDRTQAREIAEALLRFANTGRL